MSSSAINSQASSLASRLTFGVCIVPGALAAALERQAREPLPEAVGRMSVLCNGGMAPAFTRRLPVRTDMQCFHTVAGVGTGGPDGPRWLFYHDICPFRPARIHRDRLDIRK